MGTRFRPGVSGLELNARRLFFLFHNRADAPRKGRICTSGLQLEASHWVTVELKVPRASLARPSRPLYQGHRANITDSQVRIQYCLLQCGRHSSNPTPCVWTLTSNFLPNRTPDSTTWNARISYTSPGSKSVPWDRSALTGTCWLPIPGYDSQWIVRISNTWVLPASVPKP